MCQVCDHFCCTDSHYDHCGHDACYDPRCWSWEKYNSSESLNAEQLTEARTRALEQRDKQLAEVRKNDTRGVIHHRGDALTARDAATESIERKQRAADVISAEDRTIEAEAAEETANADIEVVEEPDKSDKDSHSRSEGRRHH